jgi:pantetheine-phosphate adenylyltransferase
MQTTVVFPGSFDPITLGHEDLIARASRLFPKVVVAVAKNANKKEMLSHELRVSLTQKVVEDYPNVSVVAMSGLLVDFLREHQSVLVLRGVRCAADMHYEQHMAYMNQLLMPEMDTTFLWSRPGLSAITSSGVREIHSFGGDIAKLVSPQVSAALQNIMVS